MAIRAAPKEPSTRRPRNSTSVCPGTSEAIAITIPGRSVSSTAWVPPPVGSIVEPIAKWIVGLGLGQYGTIALLMIALIIIGMFLDGVSIFLILLPVLIPIANSFGWDLVWFGVLLTMKIAIGQFTPPLAVNLMVSCRIAQVPMESTIPWVFWMIIAMFVALAMVVAVPDIALWLPRTLGY